MDKIECVTPAIAMGGRAEQEGPRKNSHGGNCTLSLGARMGPRVPRVRAGRLGRERFSTRLGGNQPLRGRPKAPKDEATLNLRGMSRKKTF